MINCTYCYLN